MSYKVILKDTAKHEIIEIKKWYHSRKIGLEIEFLIELKNCIYLIKQNPILFQIHYFNLRAAVLKRFPYLIYYSVEEKNIFIHAVLAAKQDRDPHLTYKE